jgi:transcriptional regulator with XRE-family HTH domain
VSPEDDLEVRALAVALGRQIAAERTGAGMSAEKLAERVGISKNSLGRYERAERDIPLPIIASIASALNMSAPSDLMRAAEERAARGASA